MIFCGFFQALLKAGANLDARDKAGKTARDFIDPCILKELSSAADAGDEGEELSDAE